MPLAQSNLREQGVPPHPEDMAAGNLLFDSHRRNVAIAFGGYPKPEVGHPPNRRRIEGNRIVAKPEWGNKRICQGCSAPFYDLNRSPIICPKCEAVFDPEATLKSRRPGAPKEEPKEKPKPKAAEPDEILASIEPAVDDDAIDDDDDDDDVLEDASDLGDDDVAGVVSPKDDKEDT